VLDTHVPTSEATLRQITTPTLVMIGDQDGANADQLAATLPNGRLVRVPGDHYTSLGSPEFAAAALDFLNARRNVTHVSTTR
ncbi:alpha/beta fold hydrolase, partial [Kibdelosporangium lantanae]